MYDDVYNVYEKEMNGYMTTVKDMLNDIARGGKTNVDFSEKQYIRANLANKSDGKIYDTFRGMIFGISSGLTSEEFAKKVKRYFGITDDLKTKLTVTPKEVIDTLNSNVKLHSKALVGYKKVEFTFKKFKLVAKSMQAINDKGLDKMERNGKINKTDSDYIKTLWSYFTQLSTSAVEVCMVCQRSHLKAITEEYKNMKQAAMNMIRGKSSAEPTITDDGEREVWSGEVDIDAPAPAKNI